MIKIEIFSSFKLRYHLVMNFFENDFLQSLPASPLCRGSTVFCSLKMFSFFQNVFPSICAFGPAWTFSWLRISGIKIPRRSQFSSSLFICQSFCKIRISVRRLFGPYVKSATFSYHQVSSTAIVNKRWRCYSWQHINESKVN